MNYGPASKYYDLFTAKDDINFYKELALKCGSKTLDVGVGTGRVAIELAKAGMTIWGLDSSEYMLNVTREKLRNQPNLRKLVILKLADMRNFRLRQSFPFVYVAGSTFEHCTTEADQKKCLASIYNVLESKGLLAFDISQIDASKPESSWWIDRRETEGHVEVVRTIFSRRDIKTNVVSVNLFFDVYQKGTLKERYYELGQARMSSKKEIDSILKSTGFQVLMTYGNFDKSVYTRESQKVVYVARKSQ